VGYDPRAHRQFLLDYYTGAYEDSFARGLAFGHNNKTGDARISGSLASLIGLESALEENDTDRIEQSLQRILLLHSILMSFGGIPLLYYGDEIGTINDCTYLEDESKANDSRWAHRPKIDWEKAARRNTKDTVEYKLFSAIKKMIAVRKEIPAFADYNNRELIDSQNPHLFVFSRFNYHTGSVLVVANFDDSPQYLNLNELGSKVLSQHGAICDLFSGESPAMFKDQLVIPPLHFYWLSDQIRNM
jgi:amylosucrase